MGKECPIGQILLSNSNPPNFTSPKHTFLVLYIVWDK